MNLVNPETNKTYDVAGPVHENPGNRVWCGTAKDEQLGNCFIKIMNYGKHESADTQRTARNMAEAEAKCMAQISRDCHDVPRLYDSWDDRTNRQYVLVMEQMPGVTLRKWMDKRPVSTLTQKDLFVRSMIVQQIAAIMRDIHKKHPAIVHRDLKPENILIRLDENRHWKVSVVDFGCAKLNFVRGVGTKGYHSPEQIWSDTSVQISVATDIFALGQIFYELLLGKVPEIGSDYVRIGRGNEWSERPSLPIEILSLPKGKEIDELIINMTAFNPRERWDYPLICNTLNRRSR